MVRLNNDWVRAGGNSDRENGMRSTMKGIQVGLRISKEEWKKKLSYINFVKTTKALEIKCTHMRYQPSDFKWK